MGRPVGDHPGGQGSGELLANQGPIGAHLGGPGYCGGVVTPHRSLEVEHWNKLFEEEVLEE